MNALLKPSRPTFTVSGWLDKKPQWATSRPSLVSSALYATPIPPRPTFSRIRQWEKPGANHQVDTSDRTSLSYKTGSEVNSTEQPVAAMDFLHPDAPAADRSIPKAGGID
jgi:hypothetical protein